MRYQEGRRPEQRNKKNEGLLRIDEYYDIAFDADESRFVDQFILQEGEKRLSKEYINEAATAFKAVLQAIEELLGEHELDLSKIQNIIALDTGARFIGHVIRAAVKEIKRRDNNDHETSLFFLPTNRSVTREETVQFAEQVKKYVEKQGVTGTTLLVDDLVYHGESLHQAFTLLQQAGVEDVYGVALGYADNAKFMREPEFPIIVMQNDDQLARYYSRHEGNNKLPEFHPIATTKSGHKVSADSNVSITEQYLLDIDRKSAKQIGLAAAQQHSKLSGRAL